MRRMQHNITAMQARTNALGVALHPRMSLTTSLNLRYVADYAVSLVTHRSEHGSHSGNGSLHARRRRQQLHACGRNAGHAARIGDDDHPESRSVSRRAPHAPDDAPAFADARRRRVLRALHQDHRGNRRSRCEFSGRQSQAERRIARSHAECIGAAHCHSRIVDVPPALSGHHARSRVVGPSRRSDRRRRRLHAPRRPARGFIDGGAAPRATWRSTANRRPSKISPRTRP